MCRQIAAIPTHFSKNDLLDLLQDMEGYRTGDGFGFGFVLNGEFHIKKSILTLGDILKRKGVYKDFFGDVFDHNSWVIFHHRKVSVGAACRKNNHPFICDNFMGCHNGTLKGHELIRAILGKEIQCKSDTDSEIGIRLIEKLGVKTFSRLVHDSGVFFLLDKNSNLTAIKTEFQDDLDIAEISKNKHFLISDLPCNSQFKHENAKDGYYIFDNKGILLACKEKPSRYNLKSPSISNVNKAYDSYDSRLPSNYTSPHPIDNRGPVKSIHAMNDKEFASHWCANYD